MTEDMYVPMNEIHQYKNIEWTYTKLPIPYHEIAKRGIVMWCVENMEARWTMLGGNKFGFEDATDALMFKIQFGLGA
jgi:hypothetical protein